MENNEKAVKILLEARDAIRGAIALSSLDYERNRDVMDIFISIDEIVRQLQRIGYEDYCPEQLPSRPDRTH